MLRGLLPAMPGKTWADSAGHREAGSLTPPRHWRTKANAARVRGRAVRTRRRREAKEKAAAPGVGPGARWWCDDDEGRPGPYNPAIVAGEERWPSPPASESVYQ